MSKLGKEIFTSLDLNGPYIRIDTQPTSVTKESVHGNGGTGRESRYTATFTTVGSIYFMTGDSAEVGDDTIVEQDAAPPEVANTGTITYQWYEMTSDEPLIGADYKLEDGTSNELPIKHRDRNNNTNIETTGANFSGTTSSTLTITDLQSPGDNARQFYCVIGYKIPEDDLRTGNVVNDTLTTNVVTLTVLPHIIIDTQPIGAEFDINDSIDNTTINFESRISDNRFTNDLSYQWYEVFESGGLNQLSDATEIYRPVINGTRVIERVTQGERVNQFIPNIDGNNYSITAIDELRVPFIDDDGNMVYSAKVGIPTQVTDVTVKIAGGSGGNGGGEGGNSSPGGSGGKGRFGNFKFSDELISRINNSNEPQDFTIFAGAKGEDGPPASTDKINDSTNSTNYARGGKCASSYNASNTYNIEGSAGDGGYAGPNEDSGGGGGGGGFSGIYDIEADRWLAIAGGGGGGGGGSELRPGEGGENAGDWEETSSTDSTRIETTKQATVVNFNPKCATNESSGEVDKINYGFYTKTVSSNNQVLAGGDSSNSYDRLIIIWDGELKYDETDTETINERLLSDDDGVYISINNIRYYVGTHRGSQLGWCDDDNDCGVCTRLKTEADDEDNRIDIARDRKTGGYANSFDLIRIQVEAESDGDDSTFLDDVGIYGAYGINGADKVSGDGGGGGGGGAGAFTDSRGGNAGTDPIENAIYPITASVETSNDGNNNNAYISFRNVSTEVGDQITFRKSDRNNTSNKPFRSGAVYDVVSSIDDGLTSEGIRIIPGLNRSVGLDLSDAISLDELPNDILVSLGSGVFRTVPRTVLVDGEFVGTSIIQFVVPSGNTVNQTAAEGGEGGRSAYLTDNNNSHHLIKSNGGLISDAQGHVELTFTTREGYDILNETVQNVTLYGKYSHNGTRTQTLGIISEYTFSKFYKCRISSRICSPIRTLDTDTVMVSMTDNNTGILFVEAIGTDNFAYTYSRNLNNTSGGIDVKLYPSTETGTNKVRYYSLYTKRDMDVDIRLYGGQGENRTYGSTTYSGGLGGMSYFRLKMKANTEYVIAGLDSTINTPFLFEKGTLLAAVGSGGNAGNTGDGGVGSGVNTKGGDAPNNGGIGAQKYTTLQENGIHGSASIATIFSSGDGKASGNNGGYTKKCTTGKYWAENADPTLSPCQDIPGNAKFRLPDGTEVINTAEINRGFKSGHNIFVTGGLGPDGIGNGGNGVAGGSGNINGGGGGSGFVNRTTNNFFLRDSVRDPVAQPESPDGTDSGTASGVNEGQPYVEISLADIPTQDLKQFQEYPEDIIIGTDQLEILQEGLFEPPPIIQVPVDADEPIPVASVINVYINDILQEDIPRRGRAPLSVNEGDTIKIDFQTVKIPPYSRFYWRLVSNNNTFNSNDVNSLEGDFTTNFQFTSEQISNDPTIEPSTCQGSFEFSITQDLLTEFTTSVEEFGLDIYSNSDRSFLVADLPRRSFNIIDKSRSAPTATITTFPIAMDEGSTQTFQVRTTDIPIYPNVFPEGNITLNWEIINITTSNDDFVNTSGTFNITVDDPDNSVTGTGSFTVEAKEDFTTDGASETFSLKISYNGTVLFDGTDDNTPYEITINDTSLNPVYTLTPSTATINEHDGVSFALGDTQTFTLNTQFVRPNSVFYYKVVSGHNNNNATAEIETDDFNTSFGTFTVTADNINSRTPSGTFNVITEPDALAESSENFTVQVYKTESGDYDNFGIEYPSSTSLVATSNLTVNNTTETIFILHESGEEQDVTSKQINEGESLTLNVYGRFAAGNPAAIYWKIYQEDKSTQADSSDWDGNPYGVVNLPQTNNVGNVAFTITPANDLFTDGNIPEIFYVRLALDVNYTQMIPGAEFKIDVVDTSRNPIYQFATIDGSQSSFIMDEGNTKIMQLTLENVDVGEVFYWEILKKHTSTSKETASTSDWAAVTGTVTSTSVSKHTLQWTIEGLADSSTEGGTNIDFTIRVTTGDFYSNNGDELPTNANVESFDNSGRIEIILRDTSKADTGYEIKGQYSRTYSQINEGSYADFTINLYRYTDPGFYDETTTVRFNDATLYYVVVKTDTVVEAIDDIENSSGAIDIPYYTSSVSSGSLQHKKTGFRITSIKDFSRDGVSGQLSNEFFDLLLFKSIEDATTYISESQSDDGLSQENVSLLLHRFSRFLTVYDTSYPKYAIRQDIYNSNHDSYIEYDENPNNTVYSIYFFSNLNDNFYWELRYPTAGSALNIYDGHEVIAETYSNGNLTGNTLYRGVIGVIGETGSTSTFGSGTIRDNVFYSKIDFEAPVDFSATSDTSGSIRLYDDSEYTRQSKNSTFVIDNVFSTASSKPTIYNGWKALRIKNRFGNSADNQSNHYFDDDLESIEIDPDAGIDIKGAESVTATYTITDDNNNDIDTRTWDSGPIQWLNPNATSSSSTNFARYTLNNVLESWSGTTISPSSGDWDDYVLKMVITATNAAGSTSDTRTTTFRYNPPAATASLTASSTSIIEGQSVTLTWSSTDGASYSLTDYDNPGASGNTVVYPSLPSGYSYINRTYTYTVVGKDGVSRTDSEKIRVEKQVAPTPTASLTASSTTITKGDSITLTWSSTNGDSYSLTDVQNPGSSSDPDGHVVTPSSGYSSFTKTYTYTVRNADGQAATSSVTITVQAVVVEPTLRIPRTQGAFYLRYWQDAQYSTDYTYTFGTTHNQTHDYGAGVNNRPMKLGWSHQAQGTGWVQYVNYVTVKVTTVSPNGTEYGTKTFSRTDLDPTSTTFHRLEDLFAAYQSYLIGQNNTGTTGGWSQSYDGYTVRLTVEWGNDDHGPYEYITEVDLNYNTTTTTPPTTPTPDPDPDPVDPDPVDPDPVIIITPPTTYYYYKKVPMYRYIKLDGNGHARYLHSMGDHEQGGGIPTSWAASARYYWQKLIGYCYYYDPGNGYYVPQGTRRIDDSHGAAGPRFVGATGGGYTPSNRSRYYAYPCNRSGGYIIDVDVRESSTLCSFYIDTRVGTAERDLTDNNGNSIISGWTGSAAGTAKHPNRSAYGSNNQFVMDSSNATKFDDNRGQRIWNGTTLQSGATSSGTGRWKDQSVPKSQRGWVRNWMRFDGENTSGAVKWRLPGAGTWKTTVPRLIV